MHERKKEIENERGCRKSLKSEPLASSTFYRSSVSKYLLDLPIYSKRACSCIEMFFFFLPDFSFATRLEDTLDITHSFASSYFALHTSYYTFTLQNLQRVGITRISWNFVATNPSEKSSQQESCRDFFLPMIFFLVYSYRENWFYSRCRDYTFSSKHYGYYNL